MNNNFYFLYFFFDNPFIRWARVLIFIIIGIIVWINLENADLVIKLLPVYFLLILQEIFIHFSLENRHPSKKVTDQYSHVIECVEFKTRAHLERHTDTAKIMHELLQEHDVKYFNRLLDDVDLKNFIQVPEEDALKKAQELVVSMNGSYIHAVDIYVSYLILLDTTSKELFNKGIEEKDILTVLSWVRKKAGLDGKKHKGLHFSGSGVFDFFVYGWSAELSRYASNFTREVLNGERAEPIGRADEYDLLVTALSKENASNALLVGPAGVGKTSLISQFVIDSDRSLLPHYVSNKIVFKLFAERLVAGVTNEGDLESRFVALFSELSHAGNIIVYIPNIENIFGGGGLDVDISGALVEYLKSSRIKIIASTTPAAFQKYIYPKQEIKALFDVIDINEPDDETAVYMVLEKAKEYESKNRVTISYSAVKEACVLSDSYVNDGTAMPGRAIRLLDDVIAHSKTHGIKKISKKEVQDFLQEKTHIVLSEPSKEEGQKLLGLESELHKQVISQNEAVAAISNAMRRVRSGMNDGKRPIASFLFLGPTGVGKTETAKALAQSYFGDEEAMIRLDMSEYQNSDSVERFLGKNNDQYAEILTDKVLRNPFCLILLDEFEKANPSILDLFLQVLDEGRLTDNLNRTVSFKNTIIIATSNAGSEFIREEYRDGVSSESLKTKLLEKILEAHFYKPELVNRFDEVVVFRPLNEKDVIEVSKLFLNEVVDRVSKKQITLSYDETVPEFVAKNSYSMEFGARNIKRFIEQSVENKLSKMILSQELPGGSIVNMTVVDGSIVITQQNKYT